MHLYGTKPEALAEVAATIRTHGAKNPEAVYYKHGEAVTPAEVLASRLVADPFHLLDCAITSEGGAGLVLTSAERARDLGVVPIYLLGGGVDRQGMATSRRPCGTATGRSAGAPRSGPSRKPD
jgi:acetyl-CoA acetyltransferase